MRSPQHLNGTSEKEKEEVEWMNEWINNLFMLALSHQKVCKTIRFNNHCHKNKTSNSISDGIHLREFPIFGVCEREPIGMLRQFENHKAQSLLYCG